jgi:hypothetical protein
VPYSYAIPFTPVFGHVAMVIEEDNSCVILLGVLYHYPVRAYAQRGYVIGRSVGIHISAKVQFDLLKYLLSELHCF